MYVYWCLNVRLPEIFTAVYKVYNDGHEVGVRDFFRRGMRFFRPNKIREIFRFFDQLLFQQMIFSDS